MKTKIIVAVLIVVLLSAIALPATVTNMGNAALQDILSRSREVNRDAAYGESWLVDPEGYSSHTSAFNLNATAVYFRAHIQDITEHEYVTVYFTVSKPANADSYAGLRVDVYFARTHSHVPYGFLYPDEFLGTGGHEVFYPWDYFIYLRETSSGSCNVTVPMFYMRALDIPQNQSDSLSFTYKVETYLTIRLLGAGSMTDANGTTHSYRLSTDFYFQSPTSFYKFGYPAMALLGYGVSILVAVVSICFLVYTVQRQKHNRSV